MLSLLLSTASVRAQNRDSASLSNLLFASLVPAGGMTGTIVLNYEAFWRYANHSQEHLSPDPPYAMHVDKFAHFYFSAVGSDLMRASYRATGLSNETSAWLGAGLTLATGTLVEIEDGFHGYDPEYGFSPGDWSADLVGAALTLLKTYVPKLNRLTTKLSLWPSDALKAGAYKTIADDYESQIYWLSLDLHESFSSPRWLNFAMGYSAEDLAPASLLPSRIGKTPNAMIYLGADLNLRGLPISGTFWNVILDIMDYVRIPLPALQVAPRLQWWWFR